ncbi:MAG: hypothetical protein OXI74_05515 [Rhodospirillaceae bacterium]|nr:hypothetical protein [Rhodospirillaceae bacterium]
MIALLILPNVPFTHWNDTTGAAMKPEPTGRWLLAPPAEQTSTAEAFGDGCASGGPRCVALCVISRMTKMNWKMSLAPA